MSTLAVPAQVPTAAEDSEQLKKAFKGSFFFFLTSDVSFSIDA
jgi:hypothetical protein